LLFKSGLLEGLDYPLLPLVEGNEVHVQILEGGLVLLELALED
jgi:hypothetical protein